MITPLNKIFKLRYFILFTASFLVMSFSFFQSNARCEIKKLSTAAIIKVAGANIFYTSFSIADVNISVIGPELHNNAKNNFITDKASLPHLLAIVNGGYISSFSPLRPLGLVKIDNNLLSSPVKTWVGMGLVCMKPGQISITEFDVNRVDEFRDCIQSGPFIIKNGVNRYSNIDNLPVGEKKLLNDKQEHSFVCIDDNNKIILGYAEPILLQELTEKLLNTINCKNALRLSGGATSALIVGSKIYGNSDLPIHNAIGIFAK